MSKNELMFVSFKRNQGTYIAYLPMKQFFSSDRDIESVLKEAARLYEDSILRMQSIVAEINTFRSRRILLPASKIWELGDLIFRLVESLERLSLQIDGIYDHLVQDLNVKRKWLEKAIIFRRYLPNKDIIPQSLNWGRCEKGTRRAAEKLRNGIT
jgi:hypothetical protein